MDFGLLFGSVLIDTCKNIYYNQFSRRELKTNRDAVLFNAVCGVGAVAFLLCTGCGLKISLFSLGMAFAFAVVTAAAQYCSLMSMSAGSMSYSVLFTYLGMLIPTLFGVVVYGQPVRLQQLVGFLLMLVTLVLGANVKKGEPINRRWLCFALGSFVMWGLVGVIQQIHQKSAHAGERSVFLLWAFIFLTALFAGLVGRMPRGESRYRLKSKATLPSLVSGVLIGAINWINLYLSGRLPSIVLFPILHGGVIVLSGLAARVVFREKLTRSQYAGIAIGIAAICLLGV